MKVVFTHYIRAPKNEEGWYNCEHFIDDEENIFEVELTQEEYDALYHRFTDILWNKWQGLIGDCEQDELPAEHVEEALQVVQELISTSDYPGEKTALEKLKSALEVALAAGYYIEFDNYMYLDPEKDEAP